MKTSLIILAAALALAACSGRTTTQAPLIQRLSCGAESWQQLVGLEPGEIDRTALPENHRILFPEDVVTLVHEERRLTIRVGGNGFVETVQCG